MNSADRPAVVQLDALPPLPCPCGTARRALADDPEAAASVHLVDVSADAAQHHHRRQTEIYIILEGEGAIELDGVRHPVRPLSVIRIPPGVRHRALGRLRLLNVVVPPFDPADEFHDAPPV
ncbi:MAG: cupin domain-containing protein [Limisphaerales bacterium]